MRKLIILALFLWGLIYISARPRLVTDALEYIQSTGLYQRFLSEFDIEVEESEDDFPAYFRDSEDEDYIKQKSLLAGEPPAEYRPPLRFQGVMRENGRLYAIINDRTYGINEFVGDNRIVSVNPNFIVIQGRTRRFRYTLN